MYILTNYTIITFDYSIKILKTKIKSCRLVILKLLKFISTLFGKLFSKHAGPEGTEGLFNGQICLSKHVDLAVDTK